MQAMDEAEGRYLAEIADDCQGILGPGAVLLDMTRDVVEGGVRLTAQFELDDQVWESAASGETIVEAHARLRMTLLVDRIRIGFTEYVMPR
jgi:hypothetical protein